MIIDKEKENTRLSWIDYAKGIGILLVIIGHGLPADSFLNNWIYSFHLPMFFVISGILIKPAVIDKGIKEVFIKYAKTLLLPYYFFGFIVALIEIVKDILQKDFSNGKVLNILSNWLFGVGIKADWFLPCLFIAIMISIISIKIFKNKCINIMLFFVLSMLYVYSPQANRFLDVYFKAIIAAFFVLVGYYCREFVMNVTFAQWISIVCGAVITILTFYNGKISIDAHLFGNFRIVYLFMGILGSVFVLGLLHNYNAYDLKFLRFCGKNSLIVMVIHEEIMAVWGMVLSRFMDDEGMFWLMRILFTIITTVLLVLPAKKIFDMFKKIIRFQ